MERPRRRSTEARRHRPCAGDLPACERRGALRPNPPSCRKCRRDRRGRSWRSRCSDRTNVAREQIFSMGTESTAREDAIGDAGRVDSRVGGRDEEDADEVVGVPGAGHEVDLLIRGQHGLEGDPGSLCEELLAPLLSPLGGFQDRVGRVPVAETILRDLVGVEVLDTFAPTLRAQARGDRGLPGPIGTGDHEQDGLQPAALSPGLIAYSRASADLRAAAISPRILRRDSSCAAGTWSKGALEMAGTRSSSVGSKRGVRQALGPRPSMFRG